MIEYGGVGMLCLLLDRGEWSSSSPGCFTPSESNPIPTEQEDGWVLEPEWMLWREEKSLAPPRNQTMIPQSCIP